MHNSPGLKPLMKHAIRRLYAQQPVYAMLKNKVIQEPRPNETVFRGLGDLSSRSLPFLSKLAGRSSSQLFSEASSLGICSFTRAIVPTIST